jgi:hypothetical protein
MPARVCHHQGILLKQAMIRSPRLFVGVFLVFVLIQSLSYLALYTLSSKRSMTNDYWAKAMFDYKTYALERQTAPKIIIMSGSNSTYSVDSALLEKTLGRPVINAAVHAGMDISLYYYLVERYFDEGDVLIMPLEFEYYTRANPTLTFVVSMFTWGDRLYTRRLTIPEFLEFVSFVPPKRVWRGLVSEPRRKMIKTGIAAPYNGPEETVREVLARNEGGSKLSSGYSHHDLNLYGDLLMDAGPQPGVKKLAEKGADVSEVNHEFITAVFEVL